MNVEIVFAFMPFASVSRFSAFCFFSCFLCCCCCCFLFISSILLWLWVWVCFIRSSFGIDFMWHWWCRRRCRCWQTSQATAVFPYPLIRNNSNSYIALVDWLVGATASQMNKNSEYNKKKYDMIFMLGAGWRMHVRACVCVFFYFLINLNH